jgi:hypothetical protein
MIPIEGRHSPAECAAAGAVTRSFQGGVGTGFSAIEAIPAGKAELRRESAAGYPVCGENVLLAVVHPRLHHLGKLRETRTAGRSVRRDPPSSVPGVG